MVRFEVIVGNIGSVYAGGIQRIAEQKFSEYVRQSKAAGLRASGENVTMLFKGKIRHEYIGSIAQEASCE